MAKLTKKYSKEWTFFIRQGKRSRVVYNSKCKKCIHECKQSYKVKIVACPIYQSK